jgi:hypothetical protein
MTHYSSKNALLESIHVERALLEKKISGLSPEEMIWPGCMGCWSVKDILAHLVDWEQRFVDWYQAGRRGEVPSTPALGMTWHDLPKINQVGYERHRERPLEDVLADFHSSYQTILKIIESIPEEVLFAPGYYPWTKKLNLSAYVVGNTCDHYRWARVQIRVSKIRRHLQND